MYSTKTQKDLLGELSDLPTNELRLQATHHFEEAVHMMNTSYLLPAFGPARRALERLGELLCREFGEDGEAEWERFIKALSRKP